MILDIQIYMFSDLRKYGRTWVAFIPNPESASKKDEGSQEQEKMIE